MAEIISFNKKLCNAQSKTDDKLQKAKVTAVQKIFHCTQCVIRCLKCGGQVKDPESSASTVKRDRQIPYRFCEACREEYIDYIDRLQGKPNPKFYWRNEEWLDVWQKWIEYQGSIDRYLKSKEFLDLLIELQLISPVKK